MIRISNGFKGLEGCSSNSSPCLGQPMVICLFSPSSPDVDRDRSVDGQQEKRSCVRASLTQTTLLFAVCPTVDTAISTRNLAAEMSSELHLTSLAC